MTPLTRGHRHALSIAMITVSFIGCNGDTVSSPPMKGGLNNQPGSCDVGAANNAWSSARLSGARTQPSKCPYKVDVTGQSVVFAASLYGPKETTNVNGYAELGPIVSTIDRTVVVFSMSRYWQQDPNLSSGRTLEFNGQYRAGYTPPYGPQPWARDSGLVRVFQTVYGTADAFLRMTGTAALNTGFLLVPDGISVQSAATFRAVTDVDTNSYNFAWWVDGVAIAGNNDALLTHSFSLPGNHVVRSEASYLTGTETLVSTVYAAFVVSIDGPRAIAPNEMRTWGAYIPGGYAPYSYEWTFDGMPAGTGASFSTALGPSEAHTLTLRVTDSQGFTATSTAQLISTAGGSDGTCLQEPCP